MNKNGNTSHPSNTHQEIPLESNVTEKKQTNALSSTNLWDILNKLKGKNDFIKMFINVIFICIVLVLMIIINQDSSQQKSHQENEGIVQTNVENQHKQDEINEEKTNTKLLTSESKRRTEREAEEEKTRIELFQKAKSGNHVDLYNYAKYLQNHWSVENFDNTMRESIKFMTEAAKKGNPDANYEMGMIFLVGVEGKRFNIPPNKSVAMKAFSIAAKLGHEEAKSQLYYLQRELLVEERCGKLIDDLAYEIATSPEIINNRNAQLITITKYLIKMRIQNADQVAQIIVKGINIPDHSSSKGLADKIESYQAIIRLHIESSADFY